MTPEEQQQQIEQIRQATDALRDALLSNTPPPETTLNAQVEHKPSVDAKKMLDLTDAYSAGITSPERTQMRSMEDLPQAFSQYEEHLSRFLQKMQQLVIEAIHHIETLEKHFDRLT